jgi:hypothetical protein
MYISVTQIVTCSATLVRHEKCEYCGTRYTYTLERKETSTADSPYGLDSAGAQEAATTVAQAKLENALEGAFEMVLVGSPKTGPDVMLVPLA